MKGSLVGYSFPWLGDWKLKKRGNDNEITVLKVKYLCGDPESLNRKIHLIFNRNFRISLVKW